MTREETKKCIKVMQAYVDGKTIEVKAGGRFITVSDPIWNWHFTNYRVKPELKIRPYANAKEFVKAMKEHGPALKYENAYLLTFYVASRYLKIDIPCVRKVFEFTDLLNKCTWQDGSPCGVVEE